MTGGTASGCLTAHYGGDGLLRGALQEARSIISDERDCVVESATMPIGDLSTLDADAQDDVDRYDAALGMIDASLAALAAQSPPPADDAEADLVARFSAALLAKLRASEAKYGWQRGWTKADWQSELPVKLLQHVHKGDPIDVAAYAAFAWHHGWSVQSPPLIRGEGTSVAALLAWFQSRPGCSWQATINDIERALANDPHMEQVEAARRAESRRLATPSSPEGMQPPSHVPAVERPSDPPRRPCCNTVYSNPHLLTCMAAARERGAR